MYEHHSKPILSKRLFIRRVVKHWLISLAIVAVSLGMGISGYMITEGISFIDAMLNASMLLGGMGPVTELHTNAGKLFASFYALFSGMIFLILAGVIVAPVAHRALHHFLKKEAF